MYMQGKLGMMVWIIRPGLLVVVAQAPAADDVRTLTFSPQPATCTLPKRHQFPPVRARRWLARCSPDFGAG